MTRDHRRLAAIVAADVVGYSLLMGRDDSATLAGLKAHRQEIIDPKIAEYGGRIVKTTGDGLLLEFPSVVEAVRCAVDVQRGMAERNASVPPERQIEFRIGINVGDIIIDGDDIYGDGVNVAARLQTLAEPGGICVSRVVRDQVLDKLSFAFEDLGAQEVKNIVRPVEVYRVDLGSEAQQAPLRRRRWKRLMRGPRQWLVGGAAVLVLAGISALTLSQFWKPAVPAATPPHFSVAVLPFAAPAASPADEQFAAALVNELTNDLAMTVSSMGSVVSHSLAATYRGKAIDARAVGRELNVRYLVEGDVRRAGERTVVSAQLINAGNASQVWSDSQEVDPALPMQGVAGLSILLGRQLRGALIEDEYRRAGGSPLSPGANAMDIALRAHAVYLQGNYVSNADWRKGLADARKEFERALRLDPNLVYAMVSWADTVDDELHDVHAADHDRLVHELDEITNRAVGSDRSSPTAWEKRVLALTWQWRWQAAIEATTRMSTLVPNSPWPFVHRAVITLYTGKPAEALEWLGKALAVDPRSQNEELQRQALAYRCEAYLVLGRYDEAIADCEKSEALNDYWDKHAYLAASYALKGDAAKAEAEKTLLLKDQRGLTIADLKAMRLSNDPTFLQQTETHFYAGLREAGIPER